MTMQHINDTRCDPPLPDEELDKIVAAALAYAEADVQPPDIRIVPETKKGVHLVEEPEPEDQSTAVAVTKVGSLTKDEIIALLRCSTKTRKPFPNFYNAVVLLRHDPAWCNSVYYNLFSNDLMFSRDVPRLRARAGDKVIDTHINTLAYELQADSQAEFRHDMVMNALLLVGNERAIHPVREYLKGLQWDGTARIDTWLIDHLGAQDTELTRVFSARWLLSAVGRVRVPGCEAQCCLILEGGEGIRKSRSIRALCPDPAWFTDSVGDFLNKDTWLALHGKWLVEFGELTSLRRSEVEEAKTFIGRNTDRFRAPYGRIPQDWPRQFVFAGTTNRDDYLIEANGNRRFWPVHVTGSEEGALAAVRDQLWAEAAHRYNAGEEWWLHEPRLIEEAKHLVEARESQHPWLDTITTVVSRKQVGAHIDIGTILSETIGKDLKNQTTADAMQVGRILKKLGLERVQVRVGPTRHWTYRKVK
jgi:predicted P-loop ATPase